MTLSPGSRLAHYDIVAVLGVGGMGAVYRARDSKLNRDVAIKVLLATVADDADRLARFGREAQVLASLNHPNIAAIYGIEETNPDGPAEAPRDMALVMELVEGPTLADRLATGALPVDEALAIARQIAEALLAAHEAGIVHRDLKPANIKVRDDGTVKVLDFGLAKALDPVGASSATAMNSPTLSVHATQMGLVLGTAAYMAPEQARGRAVDRRADIWAFGVVLFEMLTGRRAFEGDDISITLAAVLKDQVAWKALPADLPTPLRRLLRRCLEKDPRRRLSSIGDARLEMDDVGAAPLEEASASAPPVVNAQPAPRSRAPWMVAALSIVVAIAAVVLWAPWRAEVDPPKVSFELLEGLQGGLLTDISRQIALSPDGRHLVARVSDPSGNRLWLRPLDRLNGTVMPGTDNAAFPFWSPDGRQVGFFANNKLRIVDALGGSPQTVADAVSGRGGTWNDDGVILFAPDMEGGLVRMAASGGVPAPVTELDRSRGETAHRYPRFLPDGERFIYLIQSTQPENSGIYVGSLGSKEKKYLVAASTAAEFTSPDVLLFLREATLMAQRIDLATMALSGDAIQVAEAIDRDSGLGNSGIAVSQNGVLAYRGGGASGERYLTWIDRTGKAEGTVGQSRRYENPRLSPDGTLLAVFRTEGGGDIWIDDLARGSSTRLTFDPSVDNVPVWSPDGRRIAFMSNRDGGVFNLYVKDADGTGADELLLKTPHNKTINDWSADGQYILYSEDDPATKEDLWVLPLAAGAKPTRVVATSFSETAGSFSPDGRWIAYASNESGPRQVFVQRFPAARGKWQVSTSAGNNNYPRWRPDGKELFFDNGGTMLSVDLAGTVPGGAFKSGVPQRLFQGLQSLPPHNYDVDPGGRRFLVVTSRAVQYRPAPIVVVLNWMTGLRQ
jgi:eukaryotic-like serine/threonine-protein kinase